MASSIKALLGRTKRYFQRIFRWFIVLSQVRGTRSNDKISLIVSALASIFTSFYRLDDWQDPVLLRDSVVDVKGVGTFSLKARSDELYHVCPFREACVISAISKYLQRGEVFIDAGANIGFYSVLASKIVGTSGSVIAIEMIESTASSLMHNIDLNHSLNVRIVKAAVTNKVAPNLRALYRSGSLGQATLIQGNREEGETHQSEIVSTIKLSEILKEFQQISILKLDLEGSELDALLSAGKSLEKISNIIFELLDPIDDTLPSFLIGHGYLLERLDGRNILAKKAFLT